MSNLVSIDEFVASAQPGCAYIMRGISGAGKSSIIEKLTSKMHGMVASADRNRMVAGQYVFDAAKNGEVHGACLRDFIRYAHYGSDELEQNQIFIAVDNTALRPGDVDTYHRVASAYGWTPVVVTVYVDPEVAAARNTHGVPAAHIHRMQSQLERGDINFPKHWTHIKVRGE